MIAAPTHLARLVRVAFVLAREGVLAQVDTARMPLPARAAVACARLIAREGAGTEQGRLSAALTRLGPSHVKLGQFLATRPDIVGQALARDLEALQDKLPPFPQTQAERTVATALGRPLAYDTLEAVRMRMVEINPVFGRLGAPARNAWGPFGSDGALDDAAFVNPIRTFHMTCPISRASETMAKCIQAAEAETKRATGTHG